MLQGLGFSVPGFLGFGDLAVTISFDLCSI